MSLPTTTAEITVYGPSGSGLAGATVSYRLVKDPPNATGAFSRLTTKSAVSDSSGAISLTLIQGAEYQIRLDPDGTWRNFTAASGPTTTVPSFDGPETP